MCGKDAAAWLVLLLVTSGCAAARSQSPAVSHTRLTTPAAPDADHAGPRAALDSAAGSSSGPSGFEPAAIAQVAYFQPAPTADEAIDAPGNTAPNVEYRELPLSPPAQELDRPTEAQRPQEGTPEALPLPDPEPGEPLTLDEVLRSLEANYPLVAAAFEQRQIAAGEHTAAWGSFDLRLSGSTVNQPLGFYENFRHSLSLDQPLYGGGSVFASYRIGRGHFEPWYLERQTNEGGEFAAGARLPLAQNRDIDSRRADVLRTRYGIQVTDADISNQLVQFRLAATTTYWNWVAAGHVRRVNENLLRLAQDRQSFLRDQLAAERIAEIAVVDNERLIVTREAGVISARQRMQQAAILVSLFLRDEVGNPIVPKASRLPPELMPPEPYDWGRIDDDVQFALNNRPDLQQLAWQQRQLEVDLAAARNLLLPSIDGLVQASQDMGAPVSRPDDKGPLVFEAGVLVDVPLQRRRAQGTIRAVQGRLAQLAARRQFAENRIKADVQAAGTALVNAYAQYQQALESVDLNERLRRGEIERLQLERSDMLLVNLREQDSANAQILLINTWLQYMQAQADRLAALGM